MKHRILLTLACVAVAGMAACADDPGRAILAPDDAALVRAGEAAAPAAVRLLSRNLYLGADIDHVLEDPVNGGAIAWAEILRTSYPERAAVLAAEIAARRPHLVGLQEVSLYVVRDAATFAELGRIDFLGILAQYLAAYGVDYDVVVKADNFQTLLPVTIGGTSLVIQYADGDAILALDGVAVHESGWERFTEQANLDEYVPGLGPNFRSWQWADVTVDRQRFVFVNTHLEIQRWADIQESQTAELLGWVDGRDGPAIMVGDFNSAANPGAPAGSRTASYGLIRDAGFDDLWLRGHGPATESGLTCCQLSDLSNDAPDLNQRIDFIFARNVPSERGYAGGVALEVVGEEPADRFEAAGGYDLWPSDHAGLYGELWMPPGLMARR